MGTEVSECGPKVTVWITSTGTRIPWRINPNETVRKPTSIGSRNDQIQSNSASIKCVRERTTLSIEKATTKSENNSPFCRTPWSSRLASALIKVIFGKRQLRVYLLRIFSFTNHYGMRTMFMYHMFNGSGFHGVHKTIGIERDGTETCRRNTGKNQMWKKT
jgi:hypothetical protein